MRFVFTDESYTVHKRSKYASPAKGRADGYRRHFVLFRANLEGCPAVERYKQLSSGSNETSLAPDFAPYFRLRAQALEKNRFRELKNLHGVSLQRPITGF